MFSTTDHHLRLAIICLILLLLTGCGGTSDDLFPSGTDKRPEVTTGETGGRPGNTAPDFSVVTTDNTVFTLADHLRGNAEEVDGVVLYFTMWCPVCSAHMDHIQFSVMPLFRDKRIIYLAVDYLSDSTDYTRISQQDSGFTGSGWLAAADPGQVITGIFNGTMGTTVVIDRDGIVRLNEDFRTGDNLIAILTDLTTPTP
ncbi:MAG: peroxiredoxin family protein [Proteobacteria bacterium]|nr:peroxiredoxin family protein [Pseudomonadota bacterium]MBU1686139.1 peroxiredoxin family protein [Pseudomonadota bacterium]